MNIVEAPEFKDLVTFVPNKREPIHNWFYYKEGFSRGLVDYFINAFSIKRGSIVYDPFCGVGTTMLSCKQHGIDSKGIDVSPLACFVSYVKTRNYEIEKLEARVREALKWKFERPKELPREKWLTRAFSKYVLEDIIFYKNKIKEIESPERDFLLLGLMSAAMDCSYVYKDGAFVKIFKRSVPPLGKIFKYRIRKMLRDIKSMQTKEWLSCNAEVMLGDAREFKLEENSIDFVITSPPYLNKIEYTNIYRTEFALFFDLPETKLRSYICDRTDVPIEDAYFADMRKVLENLWYACKTGARLAIVIGGGCFPDHVVLPDVQLADIAAEIGFKLERILIARKSWCTRARTIKVGQIRESILILEK